MRAIAFGHFKDKLLSIFALHADASSGIALSVSGRCLYTAEVLKTVWRNSLNLGAHEGAENIKMVNASASSRPHPVVGVLMSAKP